MIPWRHTLNYLGLGLGAIFFVRQLWLGYQSFSSSLTQIMSPTSLVLALGLLSLTYGMQVLTWSWILMRRQWGIQLPFFHMLKGYMLSGLARYLPGGVWGYMSRGIWLEKNYAIPYNTTNASSLLQILGWFISSCMLVFVYMSIIADSWLRLLALVATIFLPLGTWLIIHNIARINRLAWLSGTGLLSLATFELSIKNWGIILCAYGGLRLGYGGALLLIINALGIFPQGNLIDASAVYTAAWLIGFLIVFVPVGLGIQEIALANLLVIQMGISLEEANVISILMRFGVLIAELVCLVCGFWTSSRRRQKTDSN